MCGLVGKNKRPSNRFKVPGSICKYGQRKAIKPSPWPPSPSDGFFPQIARTLSGSASSSPNNSDSQLRLSRSRQIEEGGVTPALPRHISGSAYARLHWAVSQAAREKRQARFAVMSHRRRPQTAFSPSVGGGADPDSSPEKKGRRSPSWAVLGSDRKVLALAVAFRAANALLVRTYFNPDEHWQCLEVAHRVAFG